MEQVAATRFGSTYRFGLVFTLFDALATRAVVSLGSHETNPLLVSVQQHIGLDGMLFARVVLGWLALFILYRMAQRVPNLGIALIGVVLALGLLAFYHVFNLLIWLGVL